MTVGEAGQLVSWHPVLGSREARRLVLPSGPHFHLWLPLVRKGPQLKLSGNKSNALVCFHGDSKSNQADSENEPPQTIAVAKEAAPLLLNEETRV